MIDAAVFTQVWGRLCRRFGRSIDNDEAADYLSYLEKSGLGTEEFVAAAEGAWATREFFPRPADFLAGQAAFGWTRALAWARSWSPQLQAEVARGLIDSIPERARRALDAIGGIDVIRKGDVGLARARFMDAFESVVIEDAAAPALAAELERTLDRTGIDPAFAPGAEQRELI